LARWPDDLVRRHAPRDDDRRRHPRDATAERAAQERLDAMTKPRGSLGVLEDVAAQLAGRALRDVATFDSAGVTGKIG
jgi:NaMN:DMB phosphoribosyltransferase